LRRPSPEDSNHGWLRIVYQAGNRVKEQFLLHPDDQYPEIAKTTGVSRDEVPRMTDVPVDANDVLFEAVTPLGFSVRVTVARWNLIVTAKHPVMAGRESLARAALETPDEVRHSRIDLQVLLF
jgi:hypothetical protein